MKEAITSGTSDNPHISCKQMSKPQKTAKQTDGLAIEYSDW